MPAAIAEIPKQRKVSSMDNPRGYKTTSLLRGKDKPFAEMTIPQAKRIDGNPVSSIPDRPVHGGQACIPCPASGDCFLRKALGDNQLQTFALGNLDEPLPEDADPRAKAAREALLSGDLKLGKVGKISFVDANGEQQTEKVTILRVGGKGFEMRVPAKKSAEEHTTPPTETVAPPPAREPASATPIEPSTAAVAVPPSIAEKPIVSGSGVRKEESKTTTAEPGPAPDKPKPVTPNITISSERKSTVKQKKDNPTPPAIDPQKRRGGFDAQIATPHQTEAPKRRGTTDHATDQTGNISKSRQVEPINKPTTGEIRTRLIHALPNILRTEIPQKEQQPPQATDKTGKDKDRVRTRVERSVLLADAPFIDFIVRTKTDILSLLRDRIATIRLSEQKRPKRSATEKQDTQRRKETKRGRQTKRTEVFTLTIIGEQQKLKKRKEKRETVRGKKVKETVAFKKGRVAEKAAKITGRRRKEAHVEISGTKPQEGQTRQRRSILTEAARAKIYERMRRRKPTETIPTKNKQELFKTETARPLILMIPGQTPVEHIAGAVTRIAKEKREKTKTPPVEIHVSSSIFIQLQKIFSEAIITNSMKREDAISIVCEGKQILLDIEKLQHLEELFADFEAQILLLQLRQCLMQSEIREATVLCGCQQQNAGNTVEKISFCQGCHQGYLQQAFFWLITILWYTIYEMTLDQKQNQLYTQTYSYEQTILTS